MEGTWVLNDSVEQSLPYKAALECSVKKRLRQTIIALLQGDFGVFILAVSLSCLTSHTWNEDTLLKQPCLYSFQLVNENRDSNLGKRDRFFVCSSVASVLLP